MEQLFTWYRNNNLSFNVVKTKEIIVGFRKTRPDHTPLIIYGSECNNTTFLMKKAQHKVHFLKWPETGKPLSSHPHQIKSVLTSRITTYWSACRGQRGQWWALWGYLSPHEKKHSANAGSAWPAALCWTPPTPHMDFSHFCHLRGGIAASQPDLTVCRIVFTPRLSGYSTPRCLDPRSQPPYICTHAHAWSLYPKDYFTLYSNDYINISNSCCYSAIYSGLTFNVRFTVANCIGILPTTRTPLTVCVQCLVIFALFIHCRPWALPFVSLYTGIWWDGNKVHLDFDLSLKTKCISGVFKADLQSVALNWIL